MQDSESAAVVVADADGNVVEHNRCARRLLGDGTGKSCWDYVGSLPGAVGLPCIRGCVQASLREGIEMTRRRRFSVDNHAYYLCCVPVGDNTMSVITRSATALPESYERLTARELQVLELVAEGYTGAEIGLELGVSPATVRAHIERMRVRMNVGTRAALVAKAIRLGLLR